MRFCDECGNPVRAAARFCGNCGAALAPNDDGEETPPSPPPSEPPPAARVGRHRRAWILGVVAFIVAVGAAATYLYAGTREWEEAESAHRQLDCAEAADRYGRAGGFFIAARPLYGDDPADRKDECRMIEAAGRLQEDGEPANAADSYRRVIDTYPRSIAREALEHAEARARLSAGAAAIATHVRVSVSWEGTPTGRSGDLLDALVAYDAVLRRYPDFEEAETARRQLAAVWRAANRGSECSMAEQMMALAGAEDVTSADAAEVKLRARQREARARLACARRQFRTGRFTGAIATLRALVDDYPRLAGVSRAANSLLIDAEVARVRGGRTGELPPPAAVGAASGTVAELTIRNASPAVLELLLSGGPTSRRATVRSCGGCPEYGEGERPVDPCATRYPGTTLRVPAGSYGAVVRTPEGDVRPFYGTWELSSGTRYAHCFWVGTRG